MAKRIEVVKKVTQVSEPVKEVETKEEPNVEEVVAESAPVNNAPITEAISLRQLDHLDWTAVKYYIQEGKVIDNEVLKTDVRDLVLRFLTQYFRKQ